MAAFVQASSNTALVAPSVSVVISVTAGNFIAVLGQSGTFSNLTGISDTAGNSYTSNGTSWSFGANDLILWFAVANSTASITITVTGSSATGNYAAIVQEFSGIIGTKDKTTKASGTSSTADSGNTATTSSANELIIGGFNYASTGAATVGTGFSNLTQVDAFTGAFGVAMESKIVSSVGAYNATLGLPGSVIWGAGVATFAASSPVARASFLYNMI